MNFTEQFERILKIARKSHALGKIPNVGDVLVYGADGYNPVAGSSLAGIAPGTVEGHVPYWNGTAWVEAQTVVLDGGVASTLTVTDNEVSLKHENAGNFCDLEVSTDAGAVDISSSCTDPSRTGINMSVVDLDNLDAFAEIHLLIDPEDGMEVSMAVSDADASHVANVVVLGNSASVTVHDDAGISTKLELISDGLNLHTQGGGDVQFSDLTLTSQSAVLTTSDSDVGESSVAVEVGSITLNTAGAVALGGTLLGFFATEPSTQATIANLGAVTGTAATDILANRNKINEILNELRSKGLIL